MLHRQQPEILTRGEDQTLDLLTRDAGSGAQIKVRPNSYDPETRTCDVMISTGARVRRRTYDGEYDELLDISPDAVRLARLNAGAQFIDSHQHYRGLDAMLGAVVPGSAHIEGRELWAKLKLSRNDKGEMIARNLMDGIPVPVSIGYRTHRELTDTTTSPPTRTAVDWEPYEVSFAPIPHESGASIRSADPALAHATSADPPRSRAATIRALGRSAHIADEIIDREIDGGSTIEQASRCFLEDQIMRSRSPFVTFGQSFDGPDAQHRAISDALYARMTGSEPSGPARPLMHKTMIDMARDLDPRLRNASSGVVFEQMMTRAGPGLSSSDFPILLADTMNRYMGERFPLMQTGASQIAVPRTVRDFRPVTEVRTTAFPEMLPVAEDGEITFGAIDEEGETAPIASYARAMNITFKVMTNDDLAGIQRGVMDHTFATVRLKAKTILAAMTATMRDGKTLFHSDHANLADTGDVPSETTLSDGRLGMMMQTPPDDTEPLGLLPTILLVPGTLQTTAEKLVTAISPVTSQDVNPFATKLQVAVEPRLIGAAWYLFASPTMWPTIRFLTLQGYEAPRFETQMEFGKLGWSYRLHWHIGALVADHRGGWKNPGKSS